MLFENIRVDEVTIPACFGTLLKLIHDGVSRGLDKDGYSTLEKDKYFDDMDNCRGGTAKERAGGSERNPRETGRERERKT